MSRIKKRFIEASAATSVIGRSANSTGVLADISASADGQVLQRSSGAISWSLILNANITNGTIDLTTKVTGVLPYANGGTNASTAWTQGSVLFAGASALAQDNSNFFWDATNHRLGIGTATVGSPLVVQSSGGGTVINSISTAAQSSTSGAIVQAAENNGSAMTSGNRLGVFSFGGNDGTTATTGAASTSAFATETWSNTAHGSKLSFKTTPNTTTTLTERLLIDQDGSATFSKYGTGIAHFSSGGLISSSAIALATADVSGILPSANVGLIRTINAQTGTTYTFALADGSGAGGNPLVTASNASAQTYTVPPNSSVAFPVGTQIDITQLGAGLVTLAQGSGVTINALAGTLAMSGQYSGATLIKTATDVWELYGNGSSGGSGGLTNPTSQITVSTGSGHGSTNTKIRRFTVTEATSGSDITFADSSTNGSSFTINTTGVYAISYNDDGNGGAAGIGISVNTSAATTSIRSLTYAQGKRTLGYAQTGNPGFVGWTGNLASGDVLRAHTDGTPDETNIFAWLTITRVN